MQVSARTDSAFPLSQKCRLLVCCLYKIIRQLFCGFAFVCCRNLKGFSVFGNGAARNLHAAESQQVGERLVRIRRGRGRGKTGGGKGIERSNEVECGFECAAVGLGQVFFIRARVWLRLPLMLSRAFRTICRAAGLAAHSPDLSICSISDSFKSAAATPAGSNFCNAVRACFSIASSNIHSKGVWSRMSSMLSVR